MSDRIVRIILRGDVAGLKGSMAVAAASVRETEAAMGRASRASAVHAKALGALGAVAKGTGLAVAGGLALAVKEAADFNEKMALVQTLSKANAAQMRELSKAAMTAGTAYGYTATQVADAQAEMIKAGVSLKNIMGGGLKGTLALAAAGQMDVADATQVAASAMTQFNLNGRQIPHVADLLAAGADKALGSVQDLGYALEQSGTTAHQMGLSIEDTTGTLAAFAQAGLIGERGGTTLKQMLLQLAAPTKQAQQLMDKYHLSLYQANGDLKSMPEIAGNVQRAFEHLTPAQRNAALGIIFGSRAISGANILMQEGQKGIAGWIRKVNDQGFAAQQASGKLNSLKGDLQKFKAAAENAFIGLGQGAQSPLRQFVQDATKELDKLTKNGDLKRWGNEAGDALRSVIDEAKTLGPEVGSALKVVGHGIKGIADGFASLPKGVQQALVTGGIVAYGAHKLGVDSLAKGLLKGGSKALGSGVGGGLFGKGVVPVYVTNEGFGGPGKGGESAPAKAGKGLLLGAATRLGPAVVAAGGLIVPHVTPKGTHTSLAPAAAGYAGDGGLSLGDHPFDFSDGAKKTTKSLAQMAAEAKAAKASAHALTSELFGSSIALQKSGLGAQQFGKALHTLPKAVQTKVTTPGVVQSVGDVKHLIDQFHLTPKQIVSLFKASGVDASKSQVLALQRQYHLTPKQVNTILAAQDRASGTVAHIQSIYAGLPRSIVTSIITNHVDKFTHLTGAHAAGGHITGPGTGTSDSIPAYLSNGEYVIRAAAVARYGVHMFDRLNAMHFASGGPVSSGGSADTKALAAEAKKAAAALKQWRQALQSARASFSLGSAFPQSNANPTTQSVRALIHQFASDIHQAGGHLAKNFDGLSARAIRLATAYDKNQRSLDAANTKMSDVQSLRDSVAGTFQHDAFGNGASGLLLQLQADANDAAKMQADLAALKAKGGKGSKGFVGSGLYSALAQSGDLNTADQLAAMSAQQLSTYSSAYAARAQATGALGDAATQVALGTTVAKLNGTISALQKQMAHQQKVIEGLGSRIEAGAERGTAKGAQKGIENRDRGAKSGRRRG